MQVKRMRSLSLAPNKPNELTSWANRTPSIVVRVGLFRRSLPAGRTRTRWRANVIRAPLQQWWRGIGLGVAVSAGEGGARRNPECRRPDVLVRTGKVDGCSSEFVRSFRKLAPSVAKTSARSASAILESVTAIFQIGIRSGQSQTQSLGSQMRAAIHKPGWAPAEPRHLPTGQNRFVIDGTPATVREVWRNWFKCVSTANQCMG